jgi:prepilin-type N-terminal cleavage/methylation domain-containing protein
MRKSTSGFTIVELLIVVVVIAILAAISVVAYTGIQNRAQDSRRFNDLRGIIQSLERYKVDRGGYPGVSFSGMGNQSGWESSAREADGQFLAPLEAFGFPGGVPVDPINNATQATAPEARTSGSFGYNYARYSAGSYGCDSSRGAYFVIGMISTAATGTESHPDSPGFSCSNRNWQSDYSWVTGGFEN